MICYYCANPACAKIGTSKGNILKAIISRGKCWLKEEKYLCKRCDIKIKKYGISRFEKEKLYKD